MSGDSLGIETAVFPDQVSAMAVAARARKVLRPQGALRRLDELAIWLAGWQRTDRPAVDHPRVVIFGGDHGVVAEGVSAYPAPVTAAMVDALRMGTATAAVMAGHVGAALDIVDVGVGTPTGNIRTEAAMDQPGFQRALEAGRMAVGDAGTTDVLLLGEIGIGNTTSAAAVCLALLGGEPEDWVGPGTGLDERGVAHKARVVADAVERIDVAEPMEVLRELGGWELAAIAGAAIEARQRSIPVLLDGFVVSAAVLPLELTEPGYLDHCWPAHVSPEPGHRRLVERLGRPPILDLEMRLGEASGALTALPLVSLAARSVVDVATFEEVGLG
jgi:nicotinate-nucleotide--dimethylbenzimidazole phosphoribosyltransferase